MEEVWTPTEAEQAMRQQRGQCAALNEVIEGDDFRMVFCDRPTDHKGHHYGLLSWAQTPEDNPASSQEEK